MVFFLYKNVYKKNVIKLLYLTLIFIFVDNKKRKVEENN